MRCIDAVSLSARYLGGVVQIANNLHVVDFRALHFEASAILRSCAGRDLTLRLHHEVVLRPVEYRNAALLIDRL
jgi:hypothetical protein